MVPTGTESTSTARDSSSVTPVDPRAPRFGQVITATVLSIGVVFREPALVLAIAVVLGVSVLSRWRLDLYSILWRNVLIPLLGKPTATEPAAPHRFAKLMGATFTAVATILLLVGSWMSLPGLVVTGYAMAGLVAALAAVAGIGDYCIGCKLYRQVSFFRRHDIV